MLIIDDVATGGAAGAGARRRWIEGDRDHHAHARGARGDPRRCKRSRRCCAGAGTILNAAQYEAAVEAGSQFIVSPGTTQELIDAADDLDIPLLPGAATASEVMGLREEGYDVMKFFPAEQAGGAAYLKSLSSPLAGTLVLPDRRHLAAKCEGLPVAAQRRLRRRFLGRAEGAGRARATGQASPGLLPKPSR